MLPPSLHGAGTGPDTPRRREYTTCEGTALFGALEQGCGMDALNGIGGASL